jgi:DNA-binding winged helix-turn-helix (wHTH) protein
MTGKPEEPSHGRRYRFGDFTLSTRRRILLQNGREQPLIPRYFDLLVFLVERRHEAVHRQAIFDRVWNDVVVSDSALSQAIRTIRRTLGDDSREPRFIRTVSRHGYRFVFAEVVEHDDAAEWVDVGRTTAENGPVEAVADPFEPLLARLTQPAAPDEDDEDQLDAAERLHALGTEEALRRLGARPGSARARALLRAARANVPGAGPVPLAGQPGAVQSVALLVQLRLRQAARVVAGRWAGASLGGACAGGIAGAAGGLILAVAPGSAAPVAVAPVLAALGAGAGAVGGAGVGAGLAIAEPITRSRRTLSLVAGGALGGGVLGLIVQWVARWSLAALVGLDVPVGGGLAGVVIGGATGLGYALATRQAEGLAAPRGGRRLRVALVTATATGLAGLALTVADTPLVGGTIHAVAQASQGAQAVLTPLGQLIGEPDFGPITGAIVGSGESALFGLGVALGLTRRP